MDRLSKLAAEQVESGDTPELIEYAGVGIWNEWRLRMSLKHGPSCGCAAGASPDRMSESLSEMAALRVAGMLRSVPRAAGPARELYG